ncbi:hypothetical protein GPECTOR_15g524 [Gonium pectorale]|uniref:Uncharacterized protein n=1 Tax=Gonium pectorale TaxID=33097 RepID=A0A150GM34_GONPE|nr:hypothetical protein GPECTOR_15g524 [Gonium pectorale]|eukprot:KXZ50838.1 hypothetical protein GPECTOR_15g524 [Gonium pectorale]
MFAAAQAPVRVKPCLHGVRAIFPYPSLGMLVVAKSDGRLLVTPLSEAELDTVLRGAGEGAPDGPVNPAERDIAVTASGCLQFSGKRGSGHGADSKAAALNPPHVQIRLHRGRLRSADACGLRLATGGAAGGIKVWDLLDIRRIAVQEVRRTCPCIAHVFTARPGSRGSGALRNVR